jgi:hypothetical protein
VLHDRLDVQGHARRDEKDRDEEPVAQGVEFFLEWGDRHPHPPRPAAQHHAGQQRTQHHVQAEPGRGQEQQQKQYHRPAQGGLRGRPLALLDDRPELIGPDDPGQEGEQEGDHAHGGDRDHRGELSPIGQEERDGQDRQQLTDGPGGQHVTPEFPGQHVVVVQDRQQGAEGGGGQGQPDGHEVTHVTERAENCHRGHRDDRTQHPARDGQPARLLTQ